MCNCKFIHPRFCTPHSHSRSALPPFITTSNLQSSHANFLLGYHPYTPPIFTSSATFLPPSLSLRRKEEASEDVFSGRDGGQLQRCLPTPFPPSSTPSA
ncbi:hypothetical protein PCANC_11088 [Puccinia coronata f. sp. avenae]|uniref:Uncharacterized protein n=1 Tax=Puccinia coronata f. sp. avenae TaxID=200324 RepID=A0A2N5UWD6_9BASI|nr:hypothetical protein PCANC_11088 [Puccinia coronata f. sp. avenae]